MDSNFKAGIRSRSDIRLDKIERLPTNNGYHIHNGARIYNKKMGEIALKFLGNAGGWTAVIFAFLTHFDFTNPLSVVLTLGSAMFVWYKALKERENWLYRRSERRKHENDNHTGNEKRRNIF